MTPRGLDIIRRAQTLGRHVAEVRVWLDVPFGPSRSFSPSGDVHGEVCVAPWERLADLDWTGIAGMPVEVVTKSDSQRSVALLCDIAAADPATLRRTVLDGAALDQVLEEFAA